MSLGFLIFNCRLICRILWHLFFTPIPQTYARWMLIARTPSHYFTRAQLTHEIAGVQRGRNEKRNGKTSSTMAVAFNVISALLRSWIWAAMSPSVLMGSRAPIVGLQIHRLNGTNGPPRALRETAA